jgi:hypothetical protein
MDVQNNHIDLNNITKSFRSIENSIAKYIYKKYIMPKPLLNDDQVEETNEELAEDEDTHEEQEHEQEQDTTIIEEIVNEDKNVLDKNAIIYTKLYKLYLQKIFDLERHSFRILQEDVFKDDFKNITIVDKAYEINPDNFNPKEYDSLPDVLRCTYIRKYKNRYYRCQNKIIDNDHDICKKHENCENIYIDKYNELHEKYQKQTQTQSQN